MLIISSNLMSVAKCRGSRVATKSRGSRVCVVGAGAGAGVGKSRG